MRAIAGLREVAPLYDAVVLDQWGVLHDGTAPYPHAADAMARLAGATRVLVLSNSGKRADENRERILRIGLPDVAEAVMTSGEALWRDVAAGRVPMRAPHVVAGDAASAARWASGLDLVFAPVEEADSLLLMGLDPAREGEALAAVAAALARGLPVICSNPDHASPRAGGAVAPSPGALAAWAQGRGARVVWYGKPHRPIFDGATHALGLGPEARILMVGDSPAHDVAGARGAGWDAALVAGGLHAARLSGGGAEAAAALCAELAAPEPDWLLEGLRW